MFEKPRVIRLRELQTMLLTWIQEGRAKETMPSMKRHNKRKFESESGNTLNFTQDRKGKQLIYPDNFTRDDYYAAECESEKNDYQSPT